MKRLLLSAAALLLSACPEEDFCEPLVEREGVCTCPEGTMPTADPFVCGLPDGGVIRGPGAGEAGVDAGDQDGGTDSGPPDGGTDAGPPDAGPGDSCVSRSFYADEDGDGFGDPTVPMMGCEIPEGFVENDGDCNDDCRDCFPGGTEVCEGSLDEDCAGGVDDGCDCTSGTERPCPGGTDTGECVSGTQRCVDGGWGPCEGGILPVTESCDGLDNDCDGTPDGPAAAAACVLSENVRSMVCAAATCEIGECEPGYGDCDERVRTGCETRTEADRDHCGMCGRSCGETQVCVLGSCREAPVLDWVSVHEAFWFEGDYEDARIAFVSSTGQVVTSDPRSTTPGGDFARGTLTAYHRDGAVAWRDDSIFQTSAMAPYADGVMVVAGDASGNALVLDRFDGVGSRLPGSPAVSAGGLPLDMATDASGVAYVVGDGDSAVTFSDPTRVVIQYDEVGGS